MRGLVVDLFAGGGGASTGLEAALERPVDVAVNHSPVAIAVHTANHPATRPLPCVRAVSFSRGAMQCRFTKTLGAFRRCETESE